MNMTVDAAMAASMTDSRCWPNGTLGGILYEGREQSGDQQHPAHDREAGSDQEQAVVPRLGSRAGQPDRRHRKPCLDVYTDLKKRTAKPATEMVARIVRVTRRDQGQAAAPDHIVELVVTETIRAAAAQERAEG
jgi:hypothetical protein